MRKQYGGAMLRALKAIVDLGPEVTNKQIIETAGIGANSITSAIENLLSRGYVNKIGSRKTRRLYITSEGRDVLCPPAPDIRNCLHCGRGFASTWQGNRICGNCKETEAWQASEVTEYPVMGGRA